MSSHSPAHIKPPRLIFSVLILILSLAAALMFAAKFEDVPAFVDDPTLCGTPAPLNPKPHKQHAKHANKKIEPHYNAGGVWSTRNNLRGLADLLYTASAESDRLLCQSLSWSAGQLVVIDATPLKATPSNASESIDLAVVSVDHVGGDIAPEFANAIRAHLESLANAKRIEFLTPLRGPDKRPKREDPYDWSFLASSEKLSDKTDIIDFSDLKPRADLPWLAQSGALLAIAEDKLDNESLNKTGVNALLAQLISKNQVAAAHAGFALTLRGPYEVMPVMTGWLGKNPRGAKLYQGLVLRRAMGTHADELIASAAVSKAPAMRALAARALGDLAQVTTDPLAKLTPLTEDSGIAVRYQAMVSCRAIPSRRAAGVAQLVEPYAMTDAMRAAYTGTMAELLTYGEPIQADSRANRLRRMPIDKLLQENRDVLACTILLERTDLPNDQINPLLKQLAERNKQGPLTALLNLLDSMNSRTLSQRTVLLDKLVSWRPNQLKARTARLKAMALGPGPIDRRSAAAAAIIMTAPPEAVLAQLGTNPIAYQGLAWIKDQSVLRRWAQPIMSRVQLEEKPLLNTVIAAINAIQWLPVDSVNKDNLKALLKIARQAEEIDLRFAAIRAINALPKSAKPADIEDLTLTVLKLAAVPREMKYDKELLTVTAGRPVELTLVNPDTMEHNLVITLPGRAQQIGSAMSADPAAAAAIGYVPKNSKAVLHYTKMIAPGDSDTLRFIAPTKPGSYEYVCTFPGHYTSMRGVLEVVAP